MNDLAFSLILLAGALLAGFLLNIVMKLLVVRLEPFSIRKSGFPLHYFGPPLGLLIPVLCLSAVSPLLRLPTEVENIIAYALQILFIGCTGWFVVRMVFSLRDLLLSRYDLEAKKTIRARQMYTQIRIIQNVLVALIVTFTIAFMLITFPGIRQIGVSILASAGIAGIVLGLAAQKTLGNFIAGLQIAFSQPIRLDDVVIVEGEWGTIEEISLTYVVVKIWDLRRLVVPISYFLEHPFQNWTRQQSSDLLGTVFVYTDYTVPVELIRKELSRILESSPLWDKKVSNLQVTDLKEWTVELRALLSAPDAGTAWNLRCEVREKLLDFLQKNFPESLPRVRVLTESVRQASVKSAK